MVFTQLLYHSQTFVRVEDRTLRDLYFTYLTFVDLDHPQAPKNILPVMVLFVIADQSEVTSLFASLLQQRPADFLDERLQRMLNNPGYANIAL